MNKIEISTVINRPVEEVFAATSNPENYPKWISTSREAKITSQGPVGVGTTYRAVATFLGRRIESDVEFTEYEPNRKIAQKSISGPFPAENSTAFERVDGGTRVTLALKGELGGFFKLAEPLLVSTLKRQVEADLANLKELMESGAL